MGTKTKISWARIIPETEGSTWNPIKGRYNNKAGYFCSKFSPGCLNCYASRINMIHGNGLEYPPISESKKYQDKVKIFSPEAGQSAIDWPLRAKKSRGIFPVSMSDWLGEFVDDVFISLMLGTMLLSQHHIFLTLTKRVKNLRNMMAFLTGQNTKGIAIPSTKHYDLAMIRLHGIKDRMDWANRHVIVLMNKRFQEVVPWGPSNIFFGISICTNQEAKAYKPYLEEIRNTVPGVQLWVSQEPALEKIDWTAHGYTKKHLDWLVWGGESDPNGKARRAHEDGAQLAIDFGKENDLPVFVKQFGTVIAQERGLPDKGDDIPVDDPLYIREFPNINGSYIEWPSR